jgi:hypothetical protein
MASRAMLTLIEGEEANEQRRSPRSRVLLSARLVTTTDSFSVKLRDLSARGARAEGDRLPPLGTDVIVERGALNAFATIVWSKDGRCGLAFDEPLSDGDLWSALGSVRPAPASDPRQFRRPGLKEAARLTADEVERARLWVHPTLRGALRG